MSPKPAELLASIRAGMRPTRLDEVIASFFPGWGRKRLENRAVMAIAGSWAGANRDRAEWKNFTPLSLSPLEEMRWDRDTLITRSADLERNDPVAGGAVAELVTSVVGTGLSLHLEPKRRLLGWTQDQAAEWAQGVQERFSLWAENAAECDIERRRNFYQSQALLVSTVATRGDAFVILPRKIHPGCIWSTKFQLVEGDRCLNPIGRLDDETLGMGVELDSTGGPKSYWISKRHPGGLMPLAQDDFVNYPAFDAKGRPQVLHLMHERRMGVRRGYPFLSNVIIPLKQLSRLSENELTASVVSSLFAVLIRKTGASSPGPLGGLQNSTDAGGNSFKEIGSGTIAELLPNEDISVVSPNRPNGAFDPFWKSIVGQIALRTQIPPEVLLKKFESSYTAARGALLQFWKFVTIERDMFLGPCYCQPTFEAWLAEDVAAGRTKAPGFFTDPLYRYAYASAKWVGDNPPILDPLKEVLAAEELVDYGFSTYEEQTTKLTGGSSEANVERLGREIALRRKAGLVPTTPTKATPAPGQPDPEEEPQPPAEPIPPGRKRGALIDAALRETT